MVQSRKESLCAGVHQTLLISTFPSRHDTTRHDTTPHLPLAPCLLLVQSDAIFLPIVVEPSKPDRVGAIHRPCMQRMGPCYWTTITDGIETTTTKPDSFLPYWSIWMDRYSNTSYEWLLHMFQSYRTPQLWCCATPRVVEVLRKTSLSRGRPWWFAWSFVFCEMKCICPWSDVTCDKCSLTYSCKLGVVYFGYYWANQMWISDYMRLQKNERSEVTPSIAPTVKRKILFKIWRVPVVRTKWIPGNLHTITVPDPWELPIGSGALFMSFGLLLIAPKK
jgi:hypothetical protein